MPPTEPWPGCGKFFTNGAVKFFRVQGAVFTHREAQQQIKQRPRRVALFSITVNDSRSPGLKVLAYGIFRLAKKLFSSTRLNLVQLISDGKRLPMKEIPTSSRPIQSYLV